jgi:ABC-2 type transport system ATP-binding protein
MSAIVTHDLTRRYGPRRGIEHVNLTVPEGSLFGFLGPNGAGKTTTIRVLLGFLKPTGGDARVFDRDVWRHSSRIKADVGYLPGDLRLYPWMNGAGALRVVGGVRGLDLRRAGRDLAERFALDLRVRVRSMSRGMRQKLGLILALAARPRLLILDEPTASLDPLVQDTLRAHLRDLAARGHTVFFSSHTLGEVEQLCDRVAIVRDGRIVADESLDGLRRRAGHEVTIRWKDPAVARGLTPPPFLSVNERDEARWHATLDGPVDELIRWLAPHAVEDLTIGRPDLETLFRRYYEPQEPAR